MAVLVRRQNVHIWMACHNGRAIKAEMRVVEGILKSGH